MNNYGLIGDPIAKSLSPALFNAGFGGKYNYDLIEGASFGNSFKTFEERYKGINVTAPFKEDAFRRADIYTSYCSKIGAANILVKTEDEAAKLIDRINKGEKFENLAKQYSIDPQSRDQGGLVGWLVPSNVDQAFGNAFKVLSAGSVAQAPILNQYGYHIVKLDAKRKAENFPTWGSQKQSLKDQLSELKAKNHFTELVQKAKVN